MYRRGMYRKSHPAPIFLAMDKFHRGQSDIKFRARLRPILYGEVAAADVCAEEERMGFEAARAN